MGIPGGVLRKKWKVLHLMQINKKTNYNESRLWWLEKKSCKMLKSFRKLKTIFITYKLKFKNLIKIQKTPKMHGDHFRFLWDKLRSTGTQLRPLSTFFSLLYFLSYFSLFVLSLELKHRHTSRVQCCHVSLFEVGKKITYHQSGCELSVRLYVRQCASLFNTLPLAFYFSD